VANSWQQTPAGFHVVVRNGVERAEMTSFWQVVFNPSSVDRLIHVLLGAFITGAFFVMSITAYYLLKRRHEEMARRGFALALIFGAICSVGQLFAGHSSARIVAQYQPAKLAAFEGIFTTAPGTPLSLFGVPDEATQSVKYGVSIPGMLSFLVHGNFQEAVKGLDEIPDDEQPPLTIPFQAYHIMVACGMYFIFITLLGLFLLWRGRLFARRRVLWVFVLSVVLPFLANQFGWAAAEVGRQPWIVQGLLRTADAVSPTVTSGEVVASLTMFTIVYLLLFVLFLWVLDRKIKAGPEPLEAGEAARAATGRDVLDAISRRGGGQYPQV
jgi:cytochrome d ubiquinol oxidase subunit I